MFQGVFQTKTYRPLKVVKVKWGSPKILLFTTEEEHERHVHGMLTRFRTSGRKLNPDKCKFKQREIKFYGIICIEDGVKPDPDKVSALLRRCHPPPPPNNSQQEVETFFIYIYTYLAPFISRFNALQAPLRELLKEKDDFDNTSLQQQASYAIGNDIKATKSLRRSMT